MVLSKPNYLMIRICFSLLTWGFDVTWKITIFSQKRRMKSDDSHQYVPSLSNILPESILHVSHGGLITPNSYPKAGVTAAGSLGMVRSSGIKAFGASAWEQPLLARSFQGTLPTVQPAPLPPQKEPRSLNPVFALS